MTEPLHILQTAIEHNLHTDFRHVQLASVDTDGHPACRTVVFRHLDADRERLFFITDARSHKAREIDKSPRVEACWYLSATREQFRLRGEAWLAGEDAPTDLVQLRAEVWDRLSPETRRLFASPAPGTPHKTGDAPDTPTSAAPSCFVLLVLEVDGVDHLQLRDHPHRRILYRKQGDDWSARRLNP